MNKQLIILILTFFCINISSAQEGSYYTSGMADYKKAEELFNKGKYADARYLFEQVLEKKSKLGQNITVDAQYYRAISAVKLYNADAEFLLNQFIENFKESPRVLQMYWIMANFQYEKSKYNKALKWYKKVDPYFLSEAQKSEYYFKVAYSYLMKEEYKEANNFFKLSIADDSKYSVPAKYFYAHLSYIEKKYETALQVFKELENDELFAPIIPYYLIQIYYYQNNTEKVFEYAPALLDSGKTRRIGEISRILAEAYYKTNQFESAFKYLKSYQNKSEDFNRKDAYLMAYSLYKTKKYDLAIDYFVPLSQKRDSVSQNALYLLGDCYLKTHQKNKAILAFQEAAAMTAIADIQEDAMYNYAKLSYELSNSPFNDAIRSLNDYLKKYPNSIHKDEIYTYLSKVFLSTKNYALAIKTIQEVKEKTPELTESYQRVCYFRGLEYFSDGNYSHAISLFETSIENSKYNNKYRALAKYWKAEANYRLGNYNLAFKDYKDFILTSGTFGSEEYKDAHYNLGYTLFKLQKYSSAIVWFRKFVEFTDTDDQLKIADAYNRIADCYFISKKYNFAIDYYDKSIKQNRRSVDYALFQKGFSQGLTKKYQDEINSLNKLITKYPESVYVDDAIFEIANAYKYLNQYKKAMNYYQFIINEHPKSEYCAKAYLDLGMLEYNDDQDTDAIATFKILIKTFPKSDEAKNALQIMKNIYIDLNDVDQYIEFANNNSVETEVSVLEADSLTFISAENLYMNENCAEAILSLKKYIEKYPKGRNLLNANYYKADCAFKNKEYSEALESFLYIIDQGTNEYTEESLLKAAFISNMYEKDQLTIALYKQLLDFTSHETSIKTAKIGLMRMFYKIKDYQNAITTAMQVLILIKQDEKLEREVHYTIAQSFFAQMDYNAAYDEYQLISDQPKTKEGAEANYKMIYINYQNGKYDDAIDIIKKFKKSNTPHQSWIAKSFMIWSDIFKANKDFFMAKATLESIIKYYNKEDDGIKKEAESKLLDIETIELLKEEENKMDSLEQAIPTPIDNSSDSTQYENNLPDEKAIEDNSETENNSNGNSLFPESNINATDTLPQTDTIPSAKPSIEPTKQDSITTIKANALDSLLNIERNISDSLNVKEKKMTPSTENNKEEKEASHE